MGKGLKEISGIQPELREKIVMPEQADSVATDVATLKADLNALLAKLRVAGLMEF